MRTLLLGATTLVALAAVAAPAPAPAQLSAGGQRLEPGVGVGSHHRDGERRHHRRDGRFDGAVVVGGWGWSDGDWALYNNRSWGPRSYNDWWHDRPDRAYPRWLSSNQGCERLWWSGGGWRC